MVDSDETTSGGGRRLGETKCPLGGRDDRLLENESCLGDTAFTVLCSHDSFPGGGSRIQVGDSRIRATSSCMYDRSQRFDDAARCLSVRNGTKVGDSVRLLRY